MSNSFTSTAFNIYVDTNSNFFLSHVIVLPEVEIAVTADIIMQVVIVAPEASIQTSATMQSISEFKTGDSIIRYFLTITGGADGLENVDISLASFHARRRTGDPTFLQAVIPSVDFVDYLTDRPNGTMVISQGYERNGEVLQREQIIETSIDDVNVYQGGQNNSIVLLGYTTSTFIPKSLVLANATYRAAVSGKIRYRLAEPNIFLNPGDTVTIGNDTITVGVMSYAISPRSQQIEIEEA